MKILQVTPSLATEGGGPTKSVPMLSQALTGLGHAVTLACMDGQIDSVARRSEAHGVRLSPLKSSDRIDGLIAAADIVHVHGIWLPFLHAFAKGARRHGVPYVVSPRGMLEPWSMRQKWLKKKIAWSLYQRADLMRAAAVHATSEMERDSIAGLCPGIGIAVVPNGTQVDEAVTAFPADGIRKLLFLGRIHPKKGLLNLVDALAGVGRNGSWQLDIVGPDEGGHLDAVLERVRMRSLDPWVRHHPAVDDALARGWIARSHVLVLPTFSENFGMVVAEALAEARPVITTTGTPWAELAEHGCGWWVPPTAHDLGTAITDFLAAPRERLEVMGRQGRQLVERKYSWASLAPSMEQVYRGAMRESERSVP